MPRFALLLMAALALACGNDGGNPFTAASPARPPSADAAILFVSGSWSAQLDAPREIMAMAANGSNPQQLTTCARAATPCDMLQVAPSPDRGRVVAVRTTPDAEAGAQALYFMDLNRSVETTSSRAGASSPPTGRGTDPSCCSPRPTRRSATRTCSPRSPTGPRSRTSPIAESARAQRSSRPARAHRGVRADRRRRRQPHLPVPRDPGHQRSRGRTGAPRDALRVGSDADPAFSPDGSHRVPPAHRDGQRRARDLGPDRDLGRGQRRPANARRPDPLSAAPRTGGRAASSSSRPTPRRRAPSSCWCSPTAPAARSSAAKPRPSGWGRRAGYTSDVPRNRSLSERLRNSLSGQDSVGWLSEAVSQEAWTDSNADESA